MKNQRNHARHHVRLILAMVGLITATAVVLGTAVLASAQAVYPSWTYTGNLNTARDGHTATLLQNGKVLVTGGRSNSNSAELYDPANGTWSATGSLITARIYQHTATLLQSGRVLVAGGFNNCSNTCSILSNAELYDPVGGTWSSTGNLNTARRAFTATLLSNGKVLVAGGYNDVSGDLSSAELYDPATGRWSSTGNLITPRGIPTATLLPNGKVLVAGGEGVAFNSLDSRKALDSAELYDPATGTWSSTTDLSAAREFHTATLLPNGRVLVAGGSNRGGDNSVPSNSELYDPVTGTWSITANLNSFRSGHTATLLSNGKVLVVGGGYTSGNVINGAELYDPATGRWTINAYLNASHLLHTATLLPIGKVLVAGGTASDLNSAELYDPGTGPNSNIVDDAKFYVQQHYADFLNRDADASGLSFWINEIASCGTNQQCIELKRINVSAAFFLSIEFQETSYFVYRVAKAAHGNLPDSPVPIKLNEFLPQTQEMGQGVVVGTPGWEQILESNKQSFVGEFDGESDRFTSAYPASMTPSEFVDTLFANAEVNPSASDRTGAINEFGSATTTGDLVTRARVLRRVAENSTLAQQEFNRAFVLMQYFGYLRRNPNDPPEPTLDFQGYNFWLSKLDQFNGNFIQAEMVKSFLVSTEYRQRFGQP